jgi:hypothetical protein
MKKYRSFVRHLSAVLLFFAVCVTATAQSAAAQAAYKRGMAALEQNKDRKSVV